MTSTGGDTVADLSDDTEPEVPEDPWKAFAYFTGACAAGFGRELIEQGRTPTEARNAVIGSFLAMAAGEACRVARSEGREPDPAKWRKATDDAFDAAVKRTDAGRAALAESGEEPADIERGAAQLEKGTTG